MVENCVYNTCLEMLEQRGYTDIEKIEEDEITILTAIKQDGEKVCVIFSGKLKLKVNRIRQYLGFMDEIECSHGIIVYSDSTTSMCKKTAEDSQDKKIELFTDSQLTFNITKHVLVPEHIRLSQEEATDFKKKFGTNLPVMLSSNPVSKFYAFERGDIIRIKDFTGIYKYRIVK